MRVLQGRIPQEQSVRLRRYSLAASAYTLALLPLAAAHWFGFMRTGPAVAIALAMVVINAGLLFVFRSGLNLRFQDPSLTKLQMYLGVTLVMFALYHVDMGRGLTLGLCFLIFLFGVFRLNTREFAALTLFTLAGYAAVVDALMFWRPEGIDDVTQEWFNWLLLAVSLPSFGVVAGKVSAMRQRLRERNEQLKKPSTRYKPWRPATKSPASTTAPSSSRACVTPWRRPSGSAMGSPCTS